MIAQMWVHVAHCAWSFCHKLNCSHMDSMYKLKGNQVITCNLASEMLTLYSKLAISMAASFLNFTALQVMSKFMGARLQLIV